jgi:hypothetical protein
MMTGSGEITEHAILSNLPTVDCSWGCNTGRIRPMPMTYSSMNTEDGGLMWYVGEGRFTDDVIPPEFFACRNRTRRRMNMVAPDGIGGVVVEPSLTYGDEGESPGERYTLILGDDGHHYRCDALDCQKGRRVTIGQPLTEVSFAKGVTLDDPPSGFVCPLCGSELALVAEEYETSVERVSTLGRPEHNSYRVVGGGIKRWVRCSSTSCPNYRVGPDGIPDFDVPQDHVRSVQLKRATT